MTNETKHTVTGDRDRAVLTLLDRTPASTAQILKASVTFCGAPFHDERRVRERLQTLARAGLVRRFQLPLPAGGSTNYYKLTSGGFRLLYGSDAVLPHRRTFTAVPLARLQHTNTLAEVIVHMFVSAHKFQIRVVRFFRENALTLRAGRYKQQPDCAAQLNAGGKAFNVLVEIDNSTESVDSNAHQSIRRKILGYEAYQDQVLAAWKRSGHRPPRPYFRVVFLTRSIERAYHILLLARELAKNRDRRLCYAATQDAYLAERDALRAPLLLDHHGQWQAVVDLHPSAPFTRAPVRLPDEMAPATMI